MSEEGSNFRVHDKRRFDSSGNERGSTEEATQDKEQAVTNSKVDNQDFELKDSEGSDEVSFSSFMVSLATQALMQMGEISSPPGMEITKDIETSKQTIDILEMIRKKTVGNLSEDEGRMMEEILHNLRIAYVRNKGV